MRQYHGLLMDVLAYGEDRPDRTGTGTRSLFGATFRHDMNNGFPLLTSKQVPFKFVAAELLWFLRGETNIRTLLDDGCTIWTDWPLARYRRIKRLPDFDQTLFETYIITDPYFAQTWGGLGPVYGKQWRKWESPARPTIHDGMVRNVTTVTDQIANAIDLIKTDPSSRRIIVDAWNPGAISEMALPPCHFAFQFYCHTDGRLSLQFHMRSTDIFLGLPFNIASYGLLLEMIAAVTHRVPGNLLATFGDLHLYDNHRDQAATLLDREPCGLPELELPKLASIDDYKLSDILPNLHGYKPHPPINAPIAV